MKFLAERAGITLPEKEYSQEERQAQDLRTRILNVNKMAAKYYYYQLRTENGRQAMEYLKKYLDVLAKKTQARVIGPADESVSKVADIYRKVIYVRHGRKEVLDQIKERTEQYIEINRGFDKITIQYDRD